VDARFVAFVAVSALLIMTPGPDTALVVRNALVAGRRAASVTTAGIALGMVCWATAAVLGIAVLIETSAVAFTVLKLAGAVYLCYLGVRTLLSGFKKSDDTVAVMGSAASMSDRIAFGQGLLSNLTNVKTGLFFITVIPQFISSADTPLRWALMFLVFEAILIGWLNLYAVAAGRAGRSRAAATIRRALNRLSGIVLVGLGLKVAFERR